MIQDNTGNIAATVPAAGTQVGSSAGYDLNPDFGNGVDLRKSPLPGQGNQIILRIDIGVGFVVGGGTPVAQIHAALSPVGAGIPIITGTDFVIVGSILPQPKLIAGARVQYGFVASELPLNAHFFMRINPWTSGLGTGATGTGIGKDYRYLGVLINVVNYDIGPGTHWFSAGAIAARLVSQSDVFDDPSDFVYPSGTPMVG